LAAVEAALWTTRRSPRALNHIPLMLSCNPFVNVAGLEDPRKPGRAIDVAGVKDKRPSVGACMRDERASSAASAS